MVKRKEDQRVCLECSKYIDIKNDNYVCLSTINRPYSPDDFAYFHFQCWVDYFNTRVENKMRSSVTLMQSNAMKIFEDPAIKEVLKQIRGTKIAMDLMNTNINSPDPILKEEIKKKLKNGKPRKRSKKSRKA